MEPEEFMQALISANADIVAVEEIDGAFKRDVVIKNTIKLREVLDDIKLLPPVNQSALVKSLAIYEQTIGGLGSATILQGILPIIDDPDHLAFDWVIQNTSSYSYFTGPANSYAEIQEHKLKREAIAKINLQIEAQRAEEGRRRKAEKATQNLPNAIKRGDIKAVQALLNKGACITSAKCNDLSAADFARQLEHEKIFQLIQEWENK